MNIRRFVFDKSTALPLKSPNELLLEIENRSLPIAMENNAELLHRKILWETWSGNKPLQNPELFRYMKAHEVPLSSSSPSDLVLSIPFKPAVWQRVAQQSRGGENKKLGGSSPSAKSPLSQGSQTFTNTATHISDTTSLNRNSNMLRGGDPQEQLDIDSNPENDYCARLAFVDYLLALPALYLLDSASLQAFESASTQYVISPFSEILLKGHHSNEVFLVRLVPFVLHFNCAEINMLSFLSRRGVIKVSRPHSLNPNVEETVQYLGWLTSA